jgi:flap endonuclease-1
MGFKLADLVPKKEISFEDLAYKRIAVDASNMLYQFLTSIRQRDGSPLTNSEGKITSHLVGLFSRIPNLMQKKLKLCFVFDGKPPLLKVKEREEREHRKQIAEKKLKEAKEAEDEELMYKYSKQTVRLTEEIINESKTLMKYLGLPIIQAPSEAEAQASYICKQKDVWAVSSSDHDCLLYGAPRVLQNLTLSTRKRMPNGSYVQITPEIIELNDVLNTLKIDHEKLLSLAILVGSDFNVGGVRGIGPKKALEIVKKFNTPVQLFNQIKPDFDWKEIISLFKNMPIKKDYKLEWKEPDYEKIKKFLVDSYDFSEERVEITLSKLTSKKTDKKQTGLKDFI